MIFILPTWQTIDIHKLIYDLLAIHTLLSQTFLKLDFVVQKYISFWSSELKSQKKYFVCLFANKQYRVKENIRILCAPSASRHAKIIVLVCAINLLLFIRKKWTKKEKDERIRRLHQNVNSNLCVCLVLNASEQEERLKNIFLEVWVVILLKNSMFVCTLQTKRIFARRKKKLYFIHLGCLNVYKNDDLFLTTGIKIVLQVKVHINWKAWERFFIFFVVYLKFMRFTGDFS